MNNIVTVSPFSIRTQEPKRGDILKRIDGNEIFMFALYENTKILISLLSGFTFYWEGTYEDEYKRGELNLLSENIIVKIQIKES